MNHANLLARNPMPFSRLSLEEKFVWLEESFVTRASVGGLTDHFTSHDFFVYRSPSF